MTEEYICEESVAETVKNSETDTSNASNTSDTSNTSDESDALLDRAENLSVDFLQNAILLLAALSWNEVMQDIVKRIYPENDRNTFYGKIIC